MKCSDCPYYWADNDEPMCCHYGYDDGYAPCEEEFDEIHIPHDECD